MNASGLPDTPKTFAEFAVFLRTLVRSISEERERWENKSLDSYLAAMAAWVDDMAGYYESQGERVPDQPDWRVLIDMFLAARVYE